MEPDVGLRELAAAAEDLAGEVQDLKRKIQVNRVWRNVLTGLVVVKAVTIIILVVTIVKVVDTQHQEQATRGQILCPLYSLFMQSVDAPRSPEESAAQYQQRVAARPLIRDSYAKLGCQPALH